MKNLLLVLAKGLVENPDAVRVEVDDINERGVTVYHLHVAKEDMGRVIGKKGRISSAIRTIMRSMAVRKREKILIEID